MTSLRAKAFAESERANRLEVELKAERLRLAASQKRIADLEFRVERAEQGACARSPRGVRARPMPSLTCHR